ncbi:hypothetical protein D6C86_02655 [Aureobasidium pullulans]|uniref:Uncharacterized protein n=1 Tax=Aureobasidium pullulans TaxID=5580 RepID=A0A4S9YF72_AURPU|nr:hypothetical protein D6C94_01704 [Aureobasidium pullulans]THZ47249.1 hypothetical protein D6C87_01589 [Aureobasidium pullulans]THZ64199.1 hypothetical protein D6C86_02655 [Aureobasidium pullulans]THZ90163.1 hypothetical protein D6C88_04252 [Aureobasidium pullulans]
MYAHNQASYGQHAPYNHFVPPQSRPMFFSQPPPPQHPASHGMFVPAGPYFNTKSRSGTAAFVPGYGNYHMPARLMFAQPNFQQYPRMPPSFHPNSWMPMSMPMPMPMPIPNFAPPSVQNSMRHLPWDW